MVDTDDIVEKTADFFSSYDVVIMTDPRLQSIKSINAATRKFGIPFYAAGIHGLYGFIFCDLIQHDFVVERQKSGGPTSLLTETRTRSVVDVKVKEAEGKAVELLTKRELYSPWTATERASLPEEYTRVRRRLNRITPLLPLFRGLWAFQAINADRLPSHHDDLAALTSLATAQNTALGLPIDSLRSEMIGSFWQNVGSELAPVSAILGGQLAQDVINVLSQKMQPIQNFVFLDGNTMEAPTYPLHPAGPLGSQSAVAGPQSGAEGV
jgi:ubiquitin-like 1-activating enzyme E1 A